MKYAFVVFEDINLGAGYVMSYLRSQGNDVRLFFDPKQGTRGYLQNRVISKLLNIQSWLLKEMKAWEPDVVCFSVLSATYQDGLNFARQIKKEVKDENGNPVRIIFGGTMPTLVPEIVSENKFIDEVIVGDGIKYFSKGIDQFDPDLLWPDRESFFSELPPEHRHTQLFMTSYGCPFNCTFCGNQQLREVGQYVKLKRTVDGCIKELKYLKQKWELNNVLFVDDILTLDKKWLLEFLPKYRSDINCPFACFGHVNCMDDEMISELAKSGCKTIWIGIQSGEEQHRNLVLNRHETNDQIIKACALIKKHGIKLMVDHICGLPYESAITHELSYNIYQTIKADVVNVYECLYFPKAKINDWALKCGYLKPDDIDKINRGQHVVYQQGNRGHHYFDKYGKAIISVPIGSGAWEFLPTWLIKLIVHLRAGRVFMLRAIIQNELFFSWRAILKKMGLWNVFK